MRELTRLLQVVNKARQMIPRYMQTTSRPNRNAKAAGGKVPVESKPQEACIDAASVACRPFTIRATRWVRYSSPVRCAYWQ